MCGRYASFLPPEQIARLFGTTNPLPTLRPTWNMAPTMTAPVVRRHPESGERHLDGLVWGLVPPFTRDLKAARKPINARAETVATSGMFRAALAKRRCLVPASAFYEWKVTSDGKIPHAIARRDGQLLAFAGIWEGWRAPDRDVPDRDVPGGNVAGGEILRTFAIVTTEANAEMATLHTRMPVILEQEDWAGWLDNRLQDPVALLRPAPEGLLRMWPVDKRVGNVRNDGPELLTAQAPPEPANTVADLPGLNPL